VTADARSSAITAGWSIHPFKSEKIAVARDDLTSSDRSLRARLIGRLRHGLLAQELVDRLARTGLVLCPYFITLEDVRGSEDLAPDPRLTMRWLSQEDITEMLRIALRKVGAAHIRELMTTSSCMGVFCDDQLAGYSWASPIRVPIPTGTGQALFELAPDEAYLFDMYVAPQYRGLRLAGLLRSQLYRALAAQGRTRAYSITLAFNRSSRRFKARLGAREIELRLYVHVRLGRLPGIDLRLWRAREPLRSPIMRRVSPVNGGHPGE
jgi:GNAT superfamily N-acetyltransferase